MGCVGPVFESRRSHYDFSNCLNPTSLATSTANFLPKKSEFINQNRKLFNSGTFDAIEDLEATIKECKYQFVCCKADLVTGGES